MLPELRLRKQRGKAWSAESDDHMEGIWTSSRGQESNREGSGERRVPICIREIWLAGAQSGLEVGKAEVRGPE